MNLCYKLQSVFDLAEEQFLFHGAIRNQEALEQLIAAYEALTPSDQATLRESLFRPSNNERRESQFDDPFLKTTKRFLGKGEGGNPPTFKGCLAILSVHRTARSAAL